MVAPALAARSGVSTCCERAVAVRARHHDDAAVLGRRVGERDPAREVRLRLDERVAVVLVPQHRLGRVRLLVDGLLPVEPHVGTDEVAAQPGEQRVRAEVAQHIGAHDEVRRDRLRVGAGDAEPAVGLPFEELLHARFAGRDRFVDRGERRRVECVLDDEEAVLVELLGLRVADRRERTGVIGPREPVVPRVWRAGVVTNGDATPVVRAPRRAVPTTAARVVLTLSTAIAASSPSIVDARLDRRGRRAPCRRSGRRSRRARGSPRPTRRAAPRTPGRRPARPARRDRAGRALRGLRVGVEVAAARVRADVVGGDRRADARVFMPSASSVAAGVNVTSEVHSGASRRRRC